MMTEPPTIEVTVTDQIRAKGGITPRQIVKALRDGRYTVREEGGVMIYNIEPEAGA